MHVATVIPIARGIPFDTLTYYCQAPLESGTIVSIPLGKRIITGIVTETIPLAEAKTMIKHAAFALKKIRQVHASIPYFREVIGALQSTSIHTLTPIGAIAGHTFPQCLFEYINSDKLPELYKNDTDEATPTFQESVIVAPTTERIDHYKRIVRSAFAAKQSVLFVAPTIRALEQWKVSLEKGIQKHVVILHSKTTKKNLRSFFATIKASDRPLLLFVTPGFLFTPRSDLAVVIAEDESSTLYKTNDRYGTDLRILLKSFCEHTGYTLIWGDTMPRLQTLEHLHATHLPRTYVPEKLHIVPTEQYRTTLPREVAELILHAQKKKKRIFIYTNRKGIAPLSRCSDCYTIVTCPTCTLPMVLRNRIHSDGNRERYFTCTHCGDTLPATHTCTYCGSWNISPLAIGTESIRDEIVSLIGSEHVYTIDDDSTPDSATVETLIKSVQQKKFAVVVGTTKVLPYLKGIEYTIIPFFDRILSTPSLYTIENVLRLVFECNERSSEGVILCTKNPDFATIRQLETQKINAIIHDELAVRKELGYPPYGLLLKISLTVPEGHRMRTSDQVNAYLEGLDSTALAPRRTSMGSMKLLMVWIVKVPFEYIEEHGSELIQFLETLRFPYKIEQNPERF